MEVSFPRPLSGNKWPGGDLFVFLALFFLQSFNKLTGMIIIGPLPQVILPLLAQCTEFQLPEKSGGCEKKSYDWASPMRQSP